ncbi:MAG: diadenylate cyclase CdaA [Desulfobacteraceae bacterium]|nr:diadenylate cyclase CdaA [Desulfobacteraceae bacterium]
MNIATALTETSDTFLMAALVVACAVVIRRDVAMRLLACMACLSLLSLSAHLANFSALIRIIDILTASTPVILAVIFQTDLRRTLLALGRRTKVTTESDEYIETVEEILKALRDMSDKQIGALIVLVRHSTIEHLIQVGTEIDAKVTSELLNSIFLPYSPIHDGAVIIEKGKLTKAGCVLPLSQNPDIAKSFGTRHRAALGLSELSDCHVVVVSEETGKISHVHEAKITYDVEHGDLRRILKKVLAVRPQP